MVKPSILLVLSLIMFSLAAKAQEVDNYVVNVGQFDKIKVCDNVNVVYKCLPDSTGFVQYRGDKQFADAFILTPKGGELKIQVSTEDVGNPNLPVVYVYSDFLTSVENSSNFSLVIENPAPCAEFKAVQIGNGSITVEGIKTNKVTASLATGNGTVTISGIAKDASYRMVGTGIISADRLEAENVQCKILGSGTIGCWALKNLSVKGIGTTKIYYKGDPKVRKAGGGKIYTLPEDRSFDTIVDDEEGGDKNPEEQNVEDE